MKKAKPTLHQLGRETIRPEDHAAVRNEIIGGTDRSAALVGAGLAETALFQALSSRLVSDEKVVEGVFFSVTAPLASFSSKIRLGRALGVYAAQMEEILDRVRRVRNVFAHAIRPLTFEHDLIEKELNALPDAKLSAEKLKANGFDLSAITAHRQRYLAVCINAMIVLEDYTLRHQGTPIAIDIPDGPSRKVIALPRGS